MLLVEELIFRVETEIQILESALDIQNDSWIKVMEKFESGEITKKDFRIIDYSFGQSVSSRVEEIEQKKELLHYLQWTYKKTTEEFENDHFQ